jgi:hypothetical protein
MSSRASSSPRRPKRARRKTRPHNRPSGVARPQAGTPSSHFSADGLRTRHDDEPHHSQKSHGASEVAPPERQTDRSHSDLIAPKTFTVRIPLTRKVTFDSTPGAVENQSLRRPLRGGPRPPARYPLARVWFRSAGICSWLLGTWIMGQFLNPVLVGFLLVWVWAGVVAAATRTAHLAYLGRYIRRAAARGCADDTPSDYYRAWHERPHGGDPDESCHDTFVAYPVESHGAVAVQLLRYRPTVITGSTTIKVRRGDPKTVTVKAAGRGFAVTIVEQRSLPSDADTAEAAELKTAVDERAARDEADANSQWGLQRQRRQDKALEDEIAKEAAERRIAQAQSTAEALKHWR